MKLKKKQIGLYLEPLFYNKVAVKCGKKHVTLSDIIRDLLREWAAGKITVKK